MTRSRDNAPHAPRRLIRKYFRTYGKYPRFRRGYLTVEACEGFIILKYRSHPIWISKKVLIELIRWLAPLIKEMGPSFDPEKAMSAYLDRELDFENEIRRMKGEARRKKRRGS